MSTENTTEQAIEEVGLAQEEVAEAPSDEQVITMTPNLEELRRKARVYDDLVAAQARAGRLKEVYLEAKEEAEAAKAQMKEDEGQYKAALEGISEIIRAQEEDYPLFPKDSQVEELPPSDESWREVRLIDLEISQPILSKLADAGLETIGAVAKYTEDGGALTRIKGIGPAKATAIDEGLDKFWAEWNRPKEFGPNEETTEVDDGDEDQESK